MKVEVLIYVYLAICVSMIIFNMVCVLVFRGRERRINKKADRFKDTLHHQFSLIRDGQMPDDRHRRYLFRKLKRTGNLLAFDESLIHLREQDAESASVYMDHVCEVFFRLMDRYRKKGEILVTFYLYILETHHVMQGRRKELLREVILPMVMSNSVYCRENALQVLYSSADADIVRDALIMLDRNGRVHNSKLLTDGLLKFAGDQAQLGDKLWEVFDSFTLSMQLVILNWSRFSSDRYKDIMLTMLTDHSRDDELVFSSIRYFGKYPDPRARPILLDYADISKDLRWEYSAIASAALAIYPGDDTVAQLKKNLHSDSWHIRFNAARSLEIIGYEYIDMVDVFEGSDRYAREMLQYRTDQLRKRQEAAQCTTV